ncbi:MAG TPA: hypothetical protein PLJ21_12100 [Pseudobdellovibrionaceae bacterium]|nr:hypothetical protein [Pseudobdellovibrionaceae bacterium]
MQKMLKPILSLWIVYHLFVIFVMPNASSYLGRSLGTYLVPYANIFGLNSPWMFFSPNPAPEYIMNISLYPKNGQGNENDFSNDEVQTLHWPEKSKSILLTTPGIRNFYLMHFLIRSPQYIETLLAPWVCRQYPNTESLHINVRVKTPPSLDKSEGLKHEDLVLSLEETNYFEKSYACN